jgi:hypothetical protein
MVVTLPVFEFSIYKRTKSNECEGDVQEERDTYFVSRIILASLDVPVRLLSGLGQNVLDDAGGLGGLRVGTCNEKMS